MDFLNRLLLFDPCEESVAWLRAYEFETPQKAWDACDRPDWMTWLIETTMEDGDCEKLILALAECLRLYSEQIPEGILEQTVSDALEERQARLREEVDENRTPDAHFRLVDSWQATPPFDADVPPALQGLICLLSLSKFPDHYHTGADVLLQVQCVLAKDLGAEVVRRRCADIMRKHYPLVPELQEYEHEDEF